jgi:hypothetical protein
MFSFVAILAKRLFKFGYIACKMIGRLNKNNRSIFMFDKVPAIMEIAFP